ncbi:hypothetical protein F5Y17DRAFT_442497 [Xylariaceae sp. FL0594]|nr:hypothetical protein F5Y17DRAFT_442497 [Xylariaceae sp. FL0594]
MPFFSPVRLFVLPFVFLVAMPLAFFASVTTMLAFAVLFFRLCLVYCDLGLETLRYVLVGHAAQARYVASHGTPSLTPTTSRDTTPVHSPAVSGFRHRRPLKRLTSAGSGSSTPAVYSNGLSRILPSSAGLERDFEGIGGWRLDSVGFDAHATAHESQWYNLNSRLETPKWRHHFRSQSGDPVMRGSGSIAGSNNLVKLKMTSSPGRSGQRTPNISKTPGFSRSGHDEYFPLV